MKNKSANSTNQFMEMHDISPHELHINLHTSLSGTPVAMQIKKSPGHF